MQNYHQPSQKLTRKTGIWIKNEEKLIFKREMVKYQNDTQHNDIQHNINIKQHSA
jgi:hypothetical protein